MNLIGRASVPDEGRWRLYNRIATRLLPLLLVGYTIACIDRVNVSFAKLQMSADIGLSDRMYGSGAGVFFIGYCLFEIPSNMILHRVGARLWLARIMIVWGVLSALGMAVRTPTEFYALRFCLGVSEAGFYPGALLFINGWFPRFARGQAVAVVLLGTSFSGIIGSPLSGAIMGFLDGAGHLRGWQWLYLIEGIPASLLGFVFLAVLPNRPAEASWLDEHEKRTVESDLAADHAVFAGAGAGHRFGDAFRNANIWCIVLANFGNLCTLYGIQFWMPTILQKAVHTGVFATGLIASALTLIPVAALLLSNRHSDRTGERRWHAVAGYATSLTGLLLAAASGDNAAMTLTGLVLANTGVAITSGMLFSLPGSFALGAAAASGLALITTLGNFAGYVSPWVIGLIKESTGSFTLAFLAMGVAAVVGAVTILLTPGLRPGRETAAVPGFAG